MENQLSLIGRGATAEVFEWEDGKILKLYREFMPKEACYHEYEITRQLAGHFSFLPKTYEFIQRDNRCGIVYEKITGRTMMVDLFKNLKNYKSYCRNLAGIQKDYQRLIDFDMVTVKEKLKSDINRAALLSQVEKDTVIAYLEKQPEKEVLCHFDFHPDNVILSEKGAIIIDWMTACKGDPCADSARTKILIKYSFVPGINPLLERFLRLFKSRMYKSYLKEYIKLTGCDYESITSWELPVAAARLAESRPPKEEKRLLKLIQKKLKAQS